MKIVDVVAHVLSTPLEEPFAFSQGRVLRRSAVVVEVLTQEGVTGWGESLCHGLQPPEVAATFVEYCYKPVLLGRDPFDAEVLWKNRTKVMEGRKKAGDAFVDPRDHPTLVHLRLRGRLSVSDVMSARRAGDSCRTALSHPGFR
jgi:L-alanine-DL-glutamate epimerase-like enolase superfamily enzyme